MSDNSGRLMRKLARLGAVATLEPDASKPGWRRYILRIDGHGAIVGFGDGCVNLLLANGKWNTFPLKKRSGGMDTAKALRTEIVDRERLAAERKASAEAARQRDDGRASAFREKEETKARTKAESQAAYDALAAEFDLIDRVRFVADEYGGASVYTDVTVNQGTARTFIETLVKAGVLRTFRRRVNP